MRQNLPVTQREYPFPPNLTVVSVTDAKGRITYCNPAFIELSGFTREELLGQPHNIVRHPDMPEEAFRDMWQTIRSGLPWSALVKNRRKDGDHYWVVANATPMFDGDRITGFLSVRTEPTRQAVEGAEQLYATMRQEAQRGHLVHRLRRGQLVRTDPWGRLVAGLPSADSATQLAVQAAGMALGGVAAYALPWMASVPVLSVIVLALFGFNRYQVRGPLQQLVRDANRLASGDLSVAVTVQSSGLAGEVQLALKQMSLNLRTVVHDVRQEVVQLMNSIAEIAQGNNDLSARTESQASSLEETAASMEQVNSTAQTTSNSAARGATLAHDAATVSQQSDVAMQAVTETMRGITEAAKQIDEMNHLIEAVAFQTNILALNAAVEAARAGEHGRGFAVVASEVRALAKRTSDAAKEIRQLVNQTGERVAQGNQRSDAAAQRMQQAIVAVNQVSSTLDQINTAAGEQRLGIAQINEAVANMDSLTQMNAALVEELAAAAQSLQTQSEGVSNSMRLFRLAGGEKTLSQA